MLVVSKRIKGEVVRNTKGNICETLTVTREVGVVVDLVVGLTEVGIGV